MLHRKRSGARLAAERPSPTGFLESSGLFSILFKQTFFVLIDCAFKIITFDLSPCFLLFEHSILSIKNVTS